MDILLIVLLFTLSQKEGGNLSDTVQNFLRFYKENREMIALLRNITQENQQSEVQANRRQEQAQPVGEHTVLDEFFKTHAL